MALYIKKDLSTSKIAKDFKLTYKTEIFTEPPRLERKDLSNQASLLWHMENADMESADIENAEMENADKHIKKSCMVDGLPYNRFGLTEKFHISFKY